MTHLPFKASLESTHGLLMGDKGVYCFLLLHTASRAPHDFSIELARTQDGRHNRPHLVSDQPTRSSECLDMAVRAATPARYTPVDATPSPTIVSTMARLLLHRHHLLLNPGAPAVPRPTSPPQLNDSPSPQNPPRSNRPSPTTATNVHLPSHSLSKLSNPHTQPPSQVPTPLHPGQYQHQTPYLPTNPSSAQTSPLSHTQLPHSTYTPSIPS